jgi:hypothetical protein
MDCMDMSPFETFTPEELEFLAKEEMIDILPSVNLDSIIFVFICCY